MVMQYAPAGLHRDYAGGVMVMQYAPAGLHRDYGSIWWGAVLRRGAPGSSSKPSPNPNPEPSPNPNPESNATTAPYNPIP